ncbi:MAG: tetratricopeptide repeat protein [Holosporales bacterium]|jgi:hypothetical protein|nr:tetratricopeptide repeat protein [Holosporales bacterium]
MLDDKNNRDSLCSCDKKKIDSFMESVEEEIRNENWQMLWKKYGKFITYLSAAILIGVGVYSMWQKRSQADIEAISTRFSSIQNAIMSGNVESYIPQIREMSNVPKKDYAILAKLEYAAILRDKNDRSCMDQYKMIFEDKGVNIVLRDLAYILYVNSCIDFMSASEIAKSIDGFIKELSEKYINGTWPLIAKESLAFCYIKYGEKDLAKQTLESIAKTSGIPVGMEERAKILLYSLEDRI